MGPADCVVLNAYESFLCHIFGFRSGVNEIFALLGFYPAFVVITYRRLGI
jgi:hypothetical protein